MSDIRGSFTAIVNGTEKEKRLDGKALFFMVMEPEGAEELEEGVRQVNAGLVGRIDIKEFIEDISDAIVETLKRAADDKYPAGILYSMLVEGTAKAISRHAEEDDHAVMEVMLGGKLQSE